MNNLVVRPAHLNDLPALKQFEQGIIKAERPFDPCLKPDPISYYDIEEMIQADWAEVLVVCDGEKIVASGYAKVKQASDYYRHSQYAFLGFMFVDEDYRGKGINQLIIDGLKQWSHEKGLNEIRLQVYVENSAALRAYEKVGFKQHVVEMRLNENQPSH